MKRNKIYQYAILLALPWLGGNLMTSCTDSFEDLNTNSVQVDPMICLSLHNVLNRCNTVIRRSRICSSSGLT